tara:strand:- start:5232 stop:6035 length:804 start_codon:yes stop_codon:yes gene_type:complete
MKEEYDLNSVVAPYADVPEDPTYYMETSRMARYPEVTLWDFIEQRPDKDWVKFSEDTGANLTDEHNAEDFFIGNFDAVSQNHDTFIDFMKNNKDTCQKKFYERRPYHAGVNEFTLDLPMKVGYNWANCCEYNWGLYGDSSHQIKEILGQKFFDEIGMDMETCLPRLLAYLPGQTLPWHFDYLGGWCRENQHLNPNPDTRRCDKGEVVRYLCFITDWHWGHMLQMANSYYPRWKSGDVYEIPQKVYHLSTNAGMTLKLSLSLSGYLPD